MGACAVGSGFGIFDEMMMHRITEVSRPRIRSICCGGTGGVASKDEGRLNIKFGPKKEDGSRWKRLEGGRI